MKVHELIAHLSQMPADADVVVRGYEDGVNDVADVRLVQIRRNVYEEWYFGSHAIEDTGDVTAVFLRGADRQPE